MRDLAQRFLYSCFRLDGESARVQLRDANWGWERLFAAAAHEAVLPALHGCTRELGLSDSLPSQVVEFLSHVEALNGERNEAILRELRLAARLLNQSGIQPVLLKGVAYLLSGVFDTPAARYLVDVDLLIPDPQIEQAVQVLQQNCFEADDNDPFARFRHHHPPLRRPGAIHFELHRTLAVGSAGSLLPVGEVLTAAKTVDLEGATVRVPCPEHMMTHLIVHSQLQHAYNERIWPPLRAMWDLVRLQRRFAGEIDWSRIERRFNAAGQRPTFILHVLRVQEALGFTPPFAVGMTPGLRLRWQRRQLLRRFPALRYFDPVYMFSTVLSRRLSMLVRVLRTPEGFGHLREEFLKPRTYRRFFQDIVEGRGK